MKTSTKGDIGESEVLTEFIRRGWTVSIPFNQSETYDLVLDDGNKIYRAQVKYASLSGNDRIKISISRSNPNARGTVDRTYNDTDLDIYVVYCWDTDEIYWIPYEEAPKTSMWLSLNGNPDDERVNCAENYRLSKRQ